MTAPVIDLFAGPGGWDLAAHHLGMRPLGIEWDTAACATRHAAGLWTRQADVGALNPTQVMRRHFTGEPLDGLIASPPCQAFSMAGKGHGRAAIDVYTEAIRRMSAHALDGTLHPMTTRELDEASGDPRGHLVLEPLRWALALGPRWIACEQVEPVLPLWEAMGQALRQHGYHTATGVLSAERYGVPQTRRRAILLASLDGPVELPAPTHARFVPPRNRDDEGGGLFDLPEPDRITPPEDAHLRPWVSMAEALGWGMTARPYLTFAVGTKNGGADPAGMGGSGSRAILHTERDAGRWMDSNASRSERRRALHGERPLTPPDHPAPTVTAHARDWRFRANAQANAAERALDEPAPTITGGHDHAERVWTTERPATTVNGDSRISQPGHHDAEVSGSQQANAVRVSLAEALILQSFPPDYPVQGTKTKQFEQVGNAVPPVLAWHVLRSVTEHRALTVPAPVGIMAG